MQEFQQIKRGREDTITIIEPKTVEHIAKVELFENTDMNEKLFEWHKDLLLTSMKKNKSFEVGYCWNLENLTEVYKIFGSKNGISLVSDVELRTWVKTAPMYSIVVMHNHPRNSYFSVYR